MRGGGRRGRWRTYYYRLERRADRGNAARVREGRTRKEREGTTGRAQTRRRRRPYSTLEATTRKAARRMGPAMGHGRRRGAPA